MGIAGREGMLTEIKTVRGGFYRPTVAWARVAPGLVLAVRGPSCTHIDDSMVAQTIGIGPNSGAFRYPSEFDTKDQALARALKSAGIVADVRWVSVAEMERAVPSYRWEE